MFVGDLSSGFTFTAQFILILFFAFNECVSYLTKCLTPSQLTAHDLEQILAAHTTLNTWPRTQRALPHTKNRRRICRHKKSESDKRQSRKSPCVPFHSSLSITRLLWFNVRDYTCRRILFSHNVSIVQFADILNQIMSVSVYKSLSMRTPSFFSCPLIHSPVFVKWQSILIHRAVTSLLSALWQRRNKPSIQMN